MQAQVEMYNYTKIKIFGLNMLEQIRRTAVSDQWHLSKNVKYGSLSVEYLLKLIFLDSMCLNRFAIYNCLFMHVWLFPITGISPLSNMGFKFAFKDSCVNQCLASNHKLWHNCTSYVYMYKRLVRLIMLFIN